MCISAEEREIAILRWRAELVDLIEQTQMKRYKTHSGKLCCNHPYRIRLGHRIIATRWIITLLEQP
jgi:hypothetical protein